MNMPVPMDEPRREWMRTLGVFLATAIVLVSLPTIVVQQYRANKSQNNHHAASAAQQATIIKLVKEVRTAQSDHASTLSEIKSLATAVNHVIAGLPAADAYLGTLALGLERQITALCSATRADCPSLNTSTP